MSEDLYTRLCVYLVADETDTSVETLLLGALRAVVELHKPSPRTSDAGHVIAVLCPGCDYAPHPSDYADWPCSTITTIAEALGLSSGTEGDPRGN